jgi:hypothetical protein
LSQQQIINVIATLNVNGQIFALCSDPARSIAQYDRAAHARAGSESDRYTIDRVCAQSLAYGLAAWSHGAVGCHPSSYVCTEYYVAAEWFGSSLIR